MRVSTFLAVSIFLVASTGQAFAECNATTKAELRELRDGYSEIRKTLRKAVARADGQMLRRSELPEGIADSLPPLPDKPVLASDMFEEDGTAKISCGDDGTAVDEISTTQAELEAFDTLVIIYVDQVGELEKLLLAAEDNAESSQGEAAAVVAPEGDPVPSTEDNVDAGDDSSPAEPQVTFREPMPDADNPGLFRRVISLPNAQLYASATANDNAEELPTFSVLYVFDESRANGQEWLEVGASLREESSGWIKQEESLSWSSMLVMNFAPRGSRSEVLFFKQATALTDLVNSAYYSTEASEIYDRLRTERESLQQNADHVPQWPSVLVAVEPETAVTFDNQPYLLPILDWREEAFDGATDTVLLKVAAVPSDARSIGSIDQNSFENSASLEAAQSDGVFRVGITFVLDTTISMRPFIERTYETVEGFFEAFNQFETAQNVSFGLVGFRDNTDRDPEGLEYTARLFQPLDIDANQRVVLATARQMKEAKVPTVGFKEDGFMGINMALTQMDWSPFDARLIVMVTDASSREGADSLAALQDTNATRLAELARLNNVAIAVIHLRTPANQDSGDFEIAAEQYRELSRTGDPNTIKYIAVDGTSDEEFASELNQLSNTIAQAVFDASAGKLVVDSTTLESIPEVGSGKLASAIRTEIFRAQLESLAAQSKGDTPSFLEGWAADRDLTDPARTALEVGVFLTRNQLSSMDKQLAAILLAFRSGGDDPKAFFENLQILATEMSTDPDKPVPEGKDVVRTILPAFLENLPYRSQVLRLDQEYWLSLSVANQQEFIENLEAKRQIYKDLDENTQKWVNFGANDPGLEATPVSLLNLP